MELVVSALVDVVTRNFPNLIFSPPETDQYATADMLINRHLIHLGKRHPNSLEQHVLLLVVVVAERLERECTLFVSRTFHWLISLTEKLILFS